MGHTNHCLSYGPLQMPNFSRSAAINFRTIEFFYGWIADFISSFQKISAVPFIIANELIAQTSMIAEWGGCSIDGEIIREMDNMGDLSLVSTGHSRHCTATSTQAGVYYWLSLRRIRISPLYP